MKSILLVKKFWGLVEMTSGLVNASFSLPEWQAVKMIFFAPCSSVANRTVASTRFKQACLFFNKSASEQTDVYVLKATLTDSMVLNLV